MSEEKLNERYGEWCQSDDGDWWCSYCGVIAEKEKDNKRPIIERCEHCGAKMKIE